MKIPGATAFHYSSVIHKNTNLFISKAAASDFQNIFNREEKRADILFSVCYIPLFCLSEQVFHSIDLSARERRAHLLPPLSPPSRSEKR